ncbi:MAG: glycosyltransferase [Methanoregulaceae archaeon]|jgi:glycosyltransferase involved in cell wall biosynthesis/SAM-dependent methyltransferase|nr:glycosyltransferase [Methanoregulaceae archaeon]
MPDPTNKHELILFSLKSCEAGEGTAYVKEYFFTSLIAEGRAILDLGCSNGCGTVALGEVAQNVTVITREKHSFLDVRVEPSPNVTFLVGDLMALPFPEKKWDIVLLFSGESINGPCDAVLSEVSRVLKEDGIFITTVQAMDIALGTPGGKYLLSEDFPSWRASIERVFPCVVGFSQTGDRGFGMVPLVPAEGGRVPENIPDKQGPDAPCIIVAARKPITLPWLNGMTLEARGPARSVLEMEHEKRIAFLESVIEQRDQELQSARFRNERLTEEVVEMKRSVLWRCAMTYHTGIVEPLLGHATRRRRWYDAGLSGLRLVSNEGISGLLWQVRGGGARTRKGFFSHVLHRSADLSTRSIRERISLIIPTKNAGYEFRYLLQKIRTQKGVSEVEIIVIDSGSSDDTVAVARSFDCHIIEISPDQFHHGGTRNAAASLATGEYLVFTVQDALPCGEFWLRDLVLPLEEDSSVSAATARQVPRSDADLFACFNLWANYQAIDFLRDKIVTAPPDYSSLSLMQWRKLAQIDDVCSAFRTMVFSDFRFLTDYAEDLDIGVRLLKAGHTLAFVHSSAVIHSHNRTAAYFFRRSYADSFTLTTVFPHDGSFIPENRSPEEILGGIFTLYQIFTAAVKILKEQFIAELSEEMTQQIKFLMKSGMTRTNATDEEVLPGDPSMDSLFFQLQKKVPFTLSSYPDTRLLKLFFNNLDTFRDFRKRCGNPPQDPAEIEAALYKLFAAASGITLGGYLALLRDGNSVHTTSLETIRTSLTEGI